MSERGAQTATLGVVLGAALVVVGIAAFVISEFASVTALIPSVFGLLIGAIGWIGRSDDRQRAAIYGIGVLAAIGVLGSLRGIPDVIAMLTGGTVDSVVAAISQGVMIVVCLVLVGSVIRYVVSNR